MAALLVQANNHGALNLEMVRDEAHLAGLYEIYYNEQSRVVSFASTDDHSSPVRVNVYYTTGTSALASRTRTRARRSSFVATSTCRRSQSSSGSRACTRGPATTAALTIQPNKRNHSTRKLSSQRSIQKMRKLSFEFKRSASRRRQTRWTRSLLRASLAA